MRLTRKTKMGRKLSMPCRRLSGIVDLGAEETRTTAWGGGGAKHAFAQGGFVG